MERVARAASGHGVYNHCTRKGSLVQVLHMGNPQLSMMPVSRLSPHLMDPGNSLQYRPIRLHCCMQTAAILMAWLSNVSIRLLVLLFISCLLGYGPFSLYQIF